MPDFHSFNRFCECETFCVLEAKKLFYCLFLSKRLELLLYCIWSLVFSFLFFSVALFLLSSSNQATTITVSPSSLVVPSLSIQNNITANSLSINETKTTSVRTSSIASSVFLTSSSKNAQSVIHSRDTKSWTKSSLATMSQTASKSISQFKYTTTLATPTTVLIVKGLPSVKVVAAIAGVLGAILLILLAVIVSMLTGLYLLNVFSHKSISSFRNRWRSMWINGREYLAKMQRVLSLQPLPAC